MKRRSFFGVLAGGAAALHVNSPLRAAVTPPVATSVTTNADPRATISMAQYTTDAFVSRVGEVFSFHRTADANDAPIRLELIGVHPSPQRGHARGREPFSLSFALRGGDATEQSTLHFRHEDFESCGWFVNRIVAPQHDPRTAHYEAVFG